MTEHEPANESRTNRDACDRCGKSGLTVYGLCNDCFIDAACDLDDVNPILAGLVVAGVLLALLAIGAGLIWWAVTP